MRDNHIYNLINQMAQEHKSLWRIKNEYKKDAGDCKECQNFWKELENEKEKNVKDLENLIKKHL